MLGGDWQLNESLDSLDFLWSDFMELREVSCVGLTHVWNSEKL